MEFNFFLLAYFKKFIFYSKLVCSFSRIAYLAQRLSCRRLQSRVDELRQSNTELEQLNVTRDCCSETDTEGDDISIKESDMNYSPKINESKSYGSTKSADDDTPLVSLHHSNHHSSKSKGSQETKYCASTNSLAASPRSISSKSGSRKRGRLVLSDDEDANMDEHVATSEECELLFVILINRGGKMGWVELGRHAKTYYHLFFLYF